MELQWAITNAHQGYDYFSQDILKKLAFQNVMQASVIKRLTSR